MALRSSEVLLLSTSDLAAVDLPCRLLAASAENLTALKSVCTALPRLLVTPRSFSAAAGSFTAPSVQRRQPARLPLACRLPPLHASNAPRECYTQPTLAPPRPPPCREDVRPNDVVLAELLNRRPPAAWLAASHDGSGGGQACELIQLVRLAGGCRSCSCCRSRATHSAVVPLHAASKVARNRCALPTTRSPRPRFPTQLQARDCVTLDTVLVARGSTFDLVLVPRPAAAQDGVAFAVFPTRVSGPCWCGVWQLEANAHKVHYSHA